MRGKVPHSFVHHLSTRITPAYAGKSTWLMIRPYRQTDHPRLCGEKVPEMLQFSSVAGSPPPMRGKGSSHCQTGKRNWDHPRLCGEKLFKLHLLFLLLGSPPPMRGKEFRMLYAYGNSRITPAYAGKRLERVPLIPSRQDHPRLCGEKRHLHRIRGIPPGSPPPMRGKVPSVGTCKTPVGITPAYAGKSAAVRRKPCSL